MKKFLLLIICSVFLLAVNVQAVPFILPADTPIYFQFNNLEQVDQSLTNSIVVPYAGAVGTTSGNWGVFNVSSIQSGGISTDHDDISGGPTIFSDDGPGGTSGQVTGIWYDVDLVDGKHATGGIMELYWTDAGSDLIDANTLNGDQGPDAGFVSLFASPAKTHLVTLNFASGILDADPITTLKSSSDLTTTGLTGFSDGFADVDVSAGGVWADLMNRDWFYTDENGNSVRGETGETHDLRFTTIYNAQNKWDDLANDVVGLRSNDPARVFTVVPEPGTFLLIGFGLLGFAGVARRKS